MLRTMAGTSEIFVFKDALIVLGTALRRGDTKFLGPRALAMVQSLGVPMLLIAR